MHRFLFSQFAVAVCFACATCACVPARAEDAPPATTDAADAASERIRPGQNSAPPKPHQSRLGNAVRSLMTQTGFPDAAMQDAIITHMESEARARGPLRESGEKLFLALQSPRVTDEQVAASLKDFQAALDADQKRRQAAETALDGKIGFVKNPRLQSMLLLFGIIGDGALFVPLREPPRANGDYRPPMRDMPRNYPGNTPREPPQGPPPDAAPADAVPIDAPK